LVETPSEAIPDSHDLPITILGAFRAVAGGRGKSITKKSVPKPELSEIGNPMR
jgi:hypothetical protein